MLKRLYEAVFKPHGFVLWVGVDLVMLGIAVIVIKFLSDIF